MTKSHGGLLDRYGLLRSIAGATRTFWFIDFDGTLTPIVRRPELVAFDARSREALAAVARRAEARVAVVSGRPVSFVRGKIGSRKIVCAGNHGLEIRGGGMAFIHPAAVAARPALLRVKRTWRALSRDYPGSLVEDKKLSVTFHFRRVRPSRQDEAARSAAGAFAELGSPPLRLTGGKMIVEARPRVRWGKGEALREIRRHWGRKRKGDLLIAVGDDETDREMFSAVNQAGLAVFVGRKKAPPEANARLADPAAVRRLIEKAGALP